MNSKTSALPHKIPLVQPILVKNDKEISRRIIFLGTPEFAAIILEKLINSQYKPMAVITEPDKPVGRKQVLTPPPVKVLAEKYKIPVFQPEKIKNFKLEIENLKPDLIVVAAYGQIIPREILKIPKYGCLNIHPSILPKYRGPSPIQATILNGDEETGVTIILMDEKIDHGPIIAQQKLKLLIANYDLPKLTEELAELGAKLLIGTLPKWFNGEIEPILQDDSKATYTKKIKKEDGKIDWKKSAEEIERMIRAYYPWPGTYTKIQSQNERSKFKILKILKARVLLFKTEKIPGKVFLTNDKKLAVVCGSNALILEEIQLEGKKRMTAQAFLNGHPEIVGSILL